MEIKSRKVLVGLGMVVIVILGAVALPIYAQRGLQGRLRSAADDISDQYSLSPIRKTTTQYEAYYGSSDYAIDRLSTDTANQGSAAAQIHIPRKVIKNATMSLKVSDVPATQVAIGGIIANFKGIVIASNVSKNGDNSMNGTSVFKVLPQDLDAAVASLRHVGEVQNEAVTGEDVTEQYVDLQGRLDNWKAVKNRLTKILDERAREVKDVLDIERELARVGGEIESMEGRLTYLNRQVNFSTVTVNYFSMKSVVVLKGIDFKERFKDTLRTATEVFVNTFNGVIVCIAFVFPLVIWGLIAWVVFIILKKFTRKR